MHFIFSYSFDQINKQISKIFASLETLLNEVVENTTKTLERNINEHSTNRKKRDDKSIATTLDNTNNNNNVASTTVMANNHERNCLTMKHQLDTDLESLKHIEVCKFLKRINLIKYEFKFITNGYDNINFMVYVLLFSRFFNIE